MELKQALDRLAELQRKMYAYQAASSSLYLDGTTVAPKDTAEGRGVALGVLAGEQHKLFSDPQVGELLDFLWAHKDGLDHPVRRQVEELRRSYDQLRRIPADEYMEYAVLTNQAGDVWRRAKEASDFQLFRPVLEKLVAFNIKFAGYYDSAKAPYDALLNEYERGWTWPIWTNSSPPCESASSPCSTRSWKRSPPTTPSCAGATLWTPSGSSPTT